MQTVLRLSRLILPAVFLGYGLVASVDFFAGDGPGRLSADLTDGGILRGGLTGDLDTVYKDDLPHRPASVGLVGAARYVLAGEGRHGVVVGRDGWLFTAEEARTEARPLAQDIAGIAKVRDRLKAAGATLVVVPVPAKIDVYRDMARLPDLSDENAARYAAFVTGLEGQGIAVADIRPALMQARHGEKPAFFATDTHWTPDGAAAAAAAIAASGLVPTGDTTFDREPEPAKEMTGDLVSFVTSDALAPVVGLAPEAVRPWTAVAEEAPAEDAGSLDIFGADTGGGVVLVGTSYSANRDWSFVEALKADLGQDVLNAAEIGRGPVHPMRTFLDKQLETIKPTTVIWEFPVRYLTDPALWDADDGPKEKSSV